MISLLEFTQTFIQRTIEDSNVRRNSHRDNCIDPFERNGDIDFTIVFDMHLHQMNFAPTLKNISKRNKTPVEIGTCSICLEKVMSNDSVHLPCAHFFHQKCCEKWTYNHRNCPTCRVNIDVAELIHNDCVSVEESDGKWRKAFISCAGDNKFSFHGLHTQGSLNLIGENVPFLRDNGLMEEISKNESSAYLRHKRRKLRQKEKKRRYQNRNV